MLDWLNTCLSAVFSRVLTVVLTAGVRLLLDKVTNPSPPRTLVAGGRRVATNILNEFRRLAGIRGRSCHRPTMPHKLDVKVEVELDKGAQCSTAPAPRPAPVAVP